ncbi:ABC transporter permease [Rhodococcus aetherivorans]|uniref:ABC transporter permease n=1 Tax=Rhodococcus aetherivorans TaxID=191292 RepID=UPI000622CF81|nr:anibiotic ABC transporter [Rhodococcus aetherivorans]AKE90915.1 anibiotic ABC transporter [Rhodococcus aetherivorans]
MNAAFVGTGRLVRLAVRRDRVQLPVWLAAIAIVYAISVSSLKGLYPAQEDLHLIAVSSAVSPVVLATNGLVSGDSLGAVVAAQTLLFLALAAGLMSTMAVVRHTRQNEETGRAELVGANVVGRRALLTAALIVVAAANVALALLLTVVSLGFGLPLSGSLALGAATGAAGVAFAAVAAVTAQVAEGARAANGLAGAALGVAFLLRAVGDSAGTVDPGGVSVTSMWLSWLSPIGWAQQIRPYDVDAWWILLLFAAFTAATTWTAYVLTGRRDHGAGLVQPRPGPDRAATWLPTAVGFAWRVQRTTLMWWALGIAVLAATYGSVANEMDNFLDEEGAVADMMKQLGGGAEAITDAYFAMIFLMMALFASGYAVQAVLRMHGEETSGRVEPVLSTALGRVPWMLAHIAVVTVGVIVLQVVTGVALAVSYGMTIGDITGPLGNLLPAALAFVPAVLLVGAMAVLCVGVAPRRASSVAWGVFAVWLIIGQLGALLDLPQAVLDLSPFVHVPALPAADMRPLPLLVLLLVAVATATAGVSAMRRRDLVVQ